MRYEKADGTTFVLAHHSPDEWADAMREKLVALGCSEQYASRVARAIRKAVPV